MGHLGASWGQLRPAWANRSQRGLTWGQLEANMDLKILEKPLFFLFFFQYFKEILGSLPKARSDQEKPAQGRAMPEKINPKGLPKAVPHQEKSTQDMVRPGKPYPRQCQARKGRPKPRPRPKVLPNRAFRAGTLQSLLSKLSY